MREATGVLVFGLAALLILLGSVDDFWDQTILLSGIILAAMVKIAGTDKRADFRERQERAERHLEEMSRRAKP